MSWFISAKCSVDEETKLWLEECFAWLLNEFGEETVRATLVVVPTEEFFPDKLTGEKRDIQIIFETVCEYMETDHRKFELCFYENEEDKFRLNLPSDEDPDQASAGFYREEDGKYVVGLQLSKMLNLESLIAAMAHEVAHGRLLGEQRLSREDENLEYLADLLTVILGMGIFNANSVFNFQQYSYMKRAGWSASRQGYLSEEMFGYALALFAYLRGEKSPDWAKFLDTDINHYFLCSLKYLLETNDTRFKRISIPQTD